MHCSWVSGQGEYFCDKSYRVFCPRVSQCPQDASFPESGSHEFIEEAAGFLCACNSGKPIGFVQLFLRKRSGDDQFCGIYGSAAPHDSRQFLENLSSRRIQVEDAVEQRDIDRIIP